MENSCWFASNNNIDSFWCLLWLKILRKSHVLETENKLLLLTITVDQSMHDKSLGYCKITFSCKSSF